MSESNWQQLRAVFGAADPLREVEKRRQRTSMDPFLVPLGPGMGYCIDARPAKNLAYTRLAAGFPGGAAGWVVLFMMHSHTLADAWTKTQALYEQLQWGTPLLHIDDDHGTLSLVMSRTHVTGCGFLGSVDPITTRLAGWLLPKYELASVDITPAEMFDVVGQDVSVVMLEGAHVPANYVAVWSPDVTVDRELAWRGHNPAYVWNAAVTTGEPVLAAFNSLAGTAYFLETFIILQTALFLATGAQLGALGRGGNVFANYIEV